MNNHRYIRNLPTVFLATSLICGSSAAAAAEQAKVDMSIVDARGRAVRMEAISPGDRAKLERLRAGVGGWIGSAPQGFKIKLDCEEGPPHSCTLKVIWGRGS